tara:strand:- start:1768 stop:2631 length:864 start_codon:yes stop_codon:yes gene_type:complete
MANIYLGEQAVTLYSGAEPETPVAQVYSENELIYNPQDLPASGYSSLVLLPFNNNFEDISGSDLNFTSSNINLDGTNKKFGLASLKNTSGGRIYNDDTNSSNALTAIGTNNFTLEFFVYFTANVSSAVLSEQSHENSYGNYKVEMIDNKIKFSYTYLNKDFDTVSTRSITSDAVSLSGWRHVAIVRQSGSGYTNSKFYMYIDGVKKATTTQPENSDQVIEFLNGGKLTIGSDKDGNNAFSGQIDHFHIRNLAVYKKGLNFTPPAAPSQDFGSVAFTTYPMISTTPAP